MEILLNSITIDSSKLINEAELYISNLDLSYPNEEVILIEKEDNN